MKKLLLCGLAAVCLYAQSDPAKETLLFRDANGSVEYICEALATQSLNVWARTSDASFQPASSIAVATLTSVADSGTTATITFSAAHGLAVGHWVTISGATVDTDLNGTYKIATVPSSTTVTVTSANVTDATYNEATLKVSTTAPRTNANVWSIQKNIYTGTDLDRSVWAYGNKSNLRACDSRTSLF